jgi:hypothetical protein
VEGEKQEATVSRPTILEVRNTRLQLIEEMNQLLFFLKGLKYQFQNKIEWHAHHPIV